MSLPVAILSGGLATRLRPITQTIPKAMAAAAGEPFIAHQLRLLRRNGIQRVVLCLGYLGEQVEAFVGDGAAFGLSVSHSYDGDTLLGTGGALRRALPWLGEAFLVLYGDSYLDIPYADVTAAFRASGQPALMTVFRNEGRWDTSNVVFRDGAIAIYDKSEKSPDMKYIDYGLSALSRTALERYPEGVAFDLAALLRELAREGRLAGFEVFNRFYEIGTPESLAEFEAYIGGRS
ncbi:MAG: nucleotidyltransferase family protein [Caulobacteraceae bacterium]